MIDRNKLLLKLLVIPLLLATSGCALFPQKQIDVSEPLPVDKRCPVDDVRKPAFPLDSINPNAPLADLVAAALAEIEIRRSYEYNLEKSFRACKYGTLK